jgi:hypothetical protein
MTDVPKHEAAEEQQSLWLLTISPALWMAHFLVSYAAAAIWCGKLGGRAAGLGGLHALILLLGVGALAGIALTGWRAWGKHTHGESEPPHDRDTPEDRHRFLGYATLLLSALSAIATVYVMISTLFLGSCV